MVTIDEWRVLWCGACRLGWLDPKPDASSLAEVYDEEYFTRNRIMTADTDDQLAGKVKDQGSLVRFIRRYKESGRLLDIGCASGYLLARAREAGFEVLGLEVSEWAADQGRQRLGLDIRQGTIESADYGPGSFDAVTMLHVVEHLDDPVASLAKVREWLRPNGVLILACPNAGSYDAGRYREQWAGWRIPYHLWHFSPTSLSSLLDRAGYSTEKVHLTRSQWMRDKMKKIPVLSILRNPISSCFSGRDMRVVARPRIERRQT